MVMHSPPAQPIPTPFPLAPATLLVGALGALSLGALAGCEPVASVALDDRARGEVVWRNCTSCHGVDGAGDQAIGAPAIAGLPAWYVEAQLLKFRSGQRGFHYDDVMGMKMRPMSLSIPSEDDVTRVAVYVSKLGGHRNKPTLDGDAKRGQPYFATCQACHGLKAEGNPAMRAPPLARQDDWYLFEQLKKFKAGARGTNPADASGATMRPMSMTLPNEQAMRDVIAAIHALEE